MAQNLVLLNENVTYLWAILLACLHLCCWHYFIGCLGNDVIGGSHLVQLNCFISWHFVVEFGPLFVIGEPNSQYGILSLHIPILGFQSRYCVGWQMAAKEITWFRFGVAVFARPLSDTIGWHPCTFIHYDLQPPVTSETAVSCAMLVKLASPQNLDPSDLCVGLQQRPLFPKRYSILWLHFQVHWRTKVYTRLW